MDTLKLHLFLRAVRKLGKYILGCVTEWRVCCSRLLISVLRCTSFRTSTGLHDIRFMCLRRCHRANRVSIPRCVSRYPPAEDCFHDMRFCSMLFNDQSMRQLLSYASNLTKGQGCRTSPGVVPAGTIDAKELLNYEKVAKRVCFTCMAEKPLRSKHSSISNRCVERFDHYCAWINNDVGLNNHHVFYGNIMFSLRPDLNTLYECRLSCFGAYCPHNNGLLLYLLAYLLSTDARSHVYVCLSSPPFRRTYLDVHSLSTLCHIRTVCCRSVCRPYEDDAKVRAI